MKEKPVRYDPEFKLRMKGIERPEFEKLFELPESPVNKKPTKKRRLVKRAK